MTEAEEFADRTLKRLQGHAQLVMGSAWPVERVTLDSAFEELGIDSLHLTEIAFALLSELDVYIPMAKVARTRSVREFIELLRAELEG